MRKFGGIGFVMLIVVVAVVLFLATRATRSVAPTALQIHDGAPQGIDDHGQDGAGQEIRSGQLPNLNQMRQGTAAHAEQLQDALEEIE